MWPIPGELTLLIAGCLLRNDLLAFSCISRYYRKLLLPLLFSTVRLNGTYKSKLNTKQGLKIFTRSEQDLKDTIRSLTAESFSETFSESVPEQANQCNKIELFQLLRTLNNLQSLSLDPEYTFYRTFNTSHIPALVEATKHVPLRLLFLKIDVECEPNRVITLGPTGLDTLSIRWNTDTLSPEYKPGGAFDHLLALITPSLASLSDLKLSFDNWEKPVSESNIFDLTLLKAAGETLRNFHLEVRDPKEVGFVVADNPFRIVAENFPKLTKLTILHHNDVHVWNDNYVDSLAFLTCLTHLTLSMDFEKMADDMLDEDHDMAWYRRCFYRRFHATEKIFSKCPQLERCSWMHLQIDSEGNEMMHDFVVVDTNQGRVVRPIMQWWMSDSYKDRHEGDLPKDMVKENAYWEDTSWSGDSVDIGW